MNCNHQKVDKMGSAYIDRDNIMHRTYTEKLEQIRELQKELRYLVKNSAEKILEDTIHDAKILRYDLWRKANYDESSLEKLVDELSSFTFSKQLYDFSDYLKMYVKKGFIWKDVSYDVKNIEYYIENKTLPKELLNRIKVTKDTPLILKNYVKFHDSKYAFVLVEIEDLKEINDHALNNLCDFDSSNFRPLAIIGFSVIDYGIMIEQIQGIKHSYVLKAFKWTYSLVKYVIDWAKKWDLRIIGIKSVKNNYWAKLTLDFWKNIKLIPEIWTIEDIIDLGLEKEKILAKRSKKYEDAINRVHLLINQGYLIYDVTAKRLGFKRSIDDNYYLKLR